MEKVAISIGSSFNSPIGKTVGLASLTSLVLSNAIIIAGIIFFFLILFGGFSMIAGAGNDNPEQVARGRQAVTAAVIGFIIIFASYWIILFIENLTGVAILNPAEPRIIQTI